MRNHPTTVLWMAVLTAPAPLASAGTPPTTDSAWSREFTVGVFCPAETSASDAITRQFTVSVPPLVLDIEVAPPGAGTTLPDVCTVDYVPAEVVPILAQAAAGFDFSSWSATDFRGSVVDEPVSACTFISMNDNTTVTANFIVSSTITVTWTGAGDGISYSDSNNWCPPVVPNEIAVERYHAVIDGAAFLARLDLSPTVTRLDVLNGAQLETVAATGPQSLTVSGGIVNTGLIRANDGQTLSINASINQNPDGGIQSFNASLVRFINGTVSRGFICTAGGGLFELVGTATLDNVGVGGLVIPDGRVLVLEGTALNVNTMFVDAMISPTGIDPLSALTLAPLPSGGSTPCGLSVEAELILGDQDLAFLGNPAAALVNESGHAIRGAGTIRASTLTNRGLVEAGPTVLGGTIPETLALSGASVNEGTLRAAGGFELKVSSAVTQTNSGLIEAAGGGSVVTIEQQITGSGAFRAGGGCGRSSLLGCTPPVLRLVDGANAAGGYLDALDYGSVELNGSAAIVLAGQITLDTDGRLFGVAPTNASISAGSILVQNTANRAGRLELDDAMSGYVGGDLSLRDNGCGRAIRGCTPPVLRVEEVARLDLDGSLFLDGPADVAVNSSQPVSLAGDFDNHSPDAARFDWLSGALSLDSAGPQRFEVAGADLGVSTNGFVQNFAMGSVEISTNGEVICTNGVANTAGAEPCVEALYARTLVLRAGATLTLMNCNVYASQVINEGAAVNPQGCGKLIPTGDYDFDGQVDLDDWAPMISCLGGPQIGPSAPECASFDLDADGDVDLGDAAVLLQRI